MRPGILPPSHTMCMKKLKISNPSHFLYEFSYSSFLIIVQLIPDRCNSPGFNRSILEKVEYEGWQIEMCWIKYLEKIQCPLRKKTSFMLDMVPRNKSQRESKICVGQVVFVILIQGVASTACTHRVSWLHCHTYTITVPPQHSRISGWYTHVVRLW